MQVKSIEELKAKGDAAEGEVRAAKKDAAKHQADGNAVRRALSAHEAALEALAAKRADVLEAANMEQVCGIFITHSLLLHDWYSVHRSDIVVVACVQRLCLSSHHCFVESGHRSGCPSRSVLT